MLGNEQLRNERNGITYFKETLRPYLSKEQTMSFSGVSCNSLGPGVETEFVGLLDLSAVPQPDDFNFILSQQQYLLLQGLTDPNERRENADRIRSEHIDAMKQAHRETFPLSDNLMSLIFLVQSDLNEQQRERFVASVSLR